MQVPPLPLLALLPLLLIIRLSPLARTPLAWHQMPTQARPLSLQLLTAAAGAACRTKPLRRHLVLLRLTKLAPAGHHRLWLRRSFPRQQRLRLHLVQQAALPFRLLGVPPPLPRLQ